MKYKEFTLDPFQVEAIEAIENNHSVVVSAATGTGKTLIADYLIEKFITENKRVIYTAPIKALSNQKFKEFTQSFGTDKVGLVTGDIVINSTAQVLIVTTEIYRNMLMVHDPIINDLSYVVFDEIHYINDIERGTVWEESVIFSPNSIRFLCLSATIPNAKEFAGWIESVNDHKVDVIEYHKRAVPLKHLVFDKVAGLTDLDTLDGVIKEQKKSGLPTTVEKDKHSKKGKKGKRQQKPQTIAASHIELVEELRDQQLLPSIFFVFSRAGCQDKAAELAKNHDLVTSQEKKRIIQIYQEKITPETKEMGTTRLLRKVIAKGIGIHHAGLLPVLKEIVEELFSEGLVKVLYTTETFAVGINMPAKAVCFNSVQKYDGIQFRYLNTKEYFQLAGRAGRRGIDTIGYSIVMIDRSKISVPKLKKVTEKDIEPIRSQFKLSYNTILNILYRHSENEAIYILKSNFDYYVRKKQSKKAIRVVTSYKHKVHQLVRKGYLQEPAKNDYMQQQIQQASGSQDQEDKHYELTEKGNFARFIYGNELLITEIVFSDFFKSLSDEDIVVLIAALEYEQRRMDKFKTKEHKKRALNLIDRISQNQFVEKEINKMNIIRLYSLVKLWLDGAEFSELLDVTNLLEGDIIRMFRRIIDILRQIKHATQNTQLRDRMTTVMEQIDRDLIAFEFPGEEIVEEL